MRLNRCNETYGYFTAKASDVSRQLAFAGIAIVWVFRVQAAEHPIIPHDLLLPMALFAITLAFDLLQYISASAAWGLLHRKWLKEWHRTRAELGIESNRDYLVPRGIKIPQSIFFIAKLCTILVAYYLMACYLWERWYLA